MQTDSSTTFFIQWIQQQDYTHKIGCEGDSLNQIVTQKKITSSDYQKSVFSAHELKCDKIIVKPRKIQEINYGFSILLFIYLLAIINFLFFNKNIKNCLKSYFLIQELTKNNKLSESKNNKGVLLTDIMFALCLGLVIFVIGKMYFANSISNFHPLLFFVFCFVISFILYGMKIIFYYFHIFLFKNNCFDFFRIQFRGYLYLFSFIVLIFMMLYFFSEQLVFIKIGIILLLINYLFYGVQNARIAIQNNFLSMYSFFLYFCAFDILPILLIIKLIIIYL